MKSLPADNIHQRLCDLRNGTGKTQKEVADELNIQASVLSRIERGETKAVSHDLVIKFAEYYNVSTDYLLCISDVRIRKNVELEERTTQLKEKEEEIENYMAETRNYDVVLHVKPEKANKIHSSVINGQKCLVIPMEENEQATINGVNTSL